MPMPFGRPDRLLDVTWTLSSGSPAGGTPLADYGVDKLTDQDPSNPLAIEETTVELQGDLGSAMRIDGVALIHHNFIEGTSLRLRVNSAASWGGAVDITVSVTVGAWMGRFAPHVYFDIAAAEPVIADRTRQYLFLENQTANDVPVRLGELVTAGEIDEFSGVLIEVQAPLTYGRSLASGKKGPQYIHDRRTRERRWDGEVYLDSVTDIGLFEGLQDQSHGTLPFLIWPLNNIEDEPVFVRFSEATYAPTLPVDLSQKRVPFSVQELACGEAY